MTHSRTPEGDALDQHVLTAWSNASHALSIPVLVAETALLLAVPGVLEWFGLVGFDQWPVHPFLFVTILLAAQYGVEGAMFAVFGATLVSWFFGWPARPIDMEYRIYFMSIWAQPLSWLFAGLIVGVVTSSRSRALRIQSEMLARSRMAERLIANQYEVLASRNRKLERSVAGLESGPVEPGGTTIREPSSAAEPRVLSRPHAR